MKKLFLIAPLLFLGCVNSSHIERKIEKRSEEMKLLNDYHITKKSLHKLGNDFIFLALSTDGSLIFYKIDKNYDLLYSKKIDLVINPIKVKVIKEKIYILAYSETENRPIFLTLDKNGNIIKKFFIGKKFNTPKDFLIENNNIIIALNSYSQNNLSDIVIYKNNQSFKFSTEYAEEISNIIPYQNGYLIIGNISKNTQDILISYLDNNFKSIWSREIDFGLEESVKEIRIVDNKIILDIVSQNYTGMEEYYTLKLDKNGNILNKNKEFEIKNYPLKFQG